MNSEILKYNEKMEPVHRDVCNLLATEIDTNLPGAECKIWHSHPVWFLDGNPTVGYSKQKPGIRLMFWSGLRRNRVERARQEVQRRFCFL